jgi:hypothetical protein
MLTKNGTLKYETKNITELLAKYHAVMSVTYNMYVKSPSDLLTPLFVLKL